MINLEKTRLVVLTLAIGLGLSMQKDPGANAPREVGQSAMGLQLSVPSVQVKRIDPVVCRDPQAPAGLGDYDLGQFWVFSGSEVVKQGQWRHPEDVPPIGCHVPGDTALREA